MRGNGSFVVIVLLAVLGAAAPAPAQDLGALGRALDERRDDAGAYDDYARAAFALGRWDEAIARLREGVARLPAYDEGHYKLGYAYRQKREWAAAVAEYRLYLARDPGRSDPWFGLGAALEGQGDVAGAVTAYQRYVALERAPAKQRFVDQARAEVAKLERLQASDAARAAEAAAAPRATEAAVAPRAVDGGRAAEAAVAPRSADAARAAAAEARRAGKWEAAIAAYREALAVEPAQAAVWYDLGYVLRQAGRPREAAEAYRRYIALRPDDADPYYGLGQSERAAGNLSGAIAAFRTYLTMPKTPGQERWVDKVRAELRTLERLQAPLMLGDGGDDLLIPAPPLGPKRGRAPVVAELDRDAPLPPASGYDDDLAIINPFAEPLPTGRLGDLKDPFPPDDDDGLIDPFDGRPQATPAVARTSTAMPSRELVRQYAAALATYRRALARHAEEVSARIERGLADAVGANPQAALRRWNDIAFDDPEVLAARRAVERLRRALQRRAP